MAEDEERLTESNPNVNTISELPGKKFAITMELPLFVVMMGVSLSGMTISSGMFVVYSMMENLGPWWFILPVIPYSLAGGFTILFTGAFCYISDITTTENRSLRMTLMEATVGLGSVVGGLLSPYVLRLVGNVYLLLIAAALNVVAYVFSNVCLRESLTGAIQGGITSVLDLLLVKEMMRECFKRRPNNGRAQILLLTIANCLTIFTLYGLLNLEYLFTRQKLHWAMKEYTQFSALSTVIRFIGSFIGIVVLQKIFRMSDLVITNFAFLTTIVEYVIRTFATKTWQMYLGASISSFKGLTAPLIRSFLTKILPIVDIAKVFSLMSAIEGLCPLLAPLFFNSLYQFTVSVFPGSIYIMSSGISLMCAVCISVVQYYRWNVSTTYQPLASA